MSENKKSPRKHRIMNHPYLALVLMPVMVLAFIFIFQGGLQSLAPELFDRLYLANLIYILVPLSCLFMFKNWWFKGEFTGSLSFRNFKKGMLMLAPFLIFMIYNLTEVESFDLTAGDIAMVIYGAQAVGIMEETTFRGLASPNFMRVHPDGHGIVLFATLSAILFGLAHMGNLTEGQDLSKTLPQVFYAFGAGVLLVAVYFRTGSLIPGITAHALVDLTSFLTPQNPSSSLFEAIFGITIGIVMAILGYWLIRKAKRDEIKAVWAEKWPARPADRETPAEPEATV